MPALRLLKMSEHPTDRAPAPSSPGEAESDSRLAIAPPARMPVPGPDPNSWADVQLAAIVDGMRESKRARDAADLHLAANSDLVLGHIRTLQTAVDGFGQRIAQLDALVGSGFTRVDRELETITAEVLTLKSQMGIFKSEMAALEARLEALPLSKPTG